MIVLGIIGDERVAHSLSPRMHNAVMAKHGLEGSYVRFAVKPQDMAAAVAGVGALGLTGVNVTVPHKQAVIPFLAELSDEAAALGAVNTIKPEAGKLVGYNTDLAGVRQALAEVGFELKGAKALVLGAGGAARAVVLALLQGGANVQVASRRPSQAEALCAELGGKGSSLDQVAGVLPNIDLLVNATSVSSPKESPDMTVWLENLSPPANLALVMDINYGRSGNVWQKFALRSQAEFMDGLPMLAHQARLSFQIWTGIDASVEEFKAGLETTT
jgi:shikimate dehydrogenase